MEKDKVTFTVEDVDGLYMSDPEETKNEISDLPTEKTPLLGESLIASDNKHVHALHGSTSAIHTRIASMTSTISTSIRQLKKSVGFLQGFCLIVGILIGSGVFISPSLVMHDTGDVVMTLGVWIICGVIALGGSLCYCELGCSIKKAGGNYAYILEAYGGLPAFLCCWTVGFIIDPSATAAITLTFGTYVMKAFEGVVEPNPVFPKVVAALCIFIVAFVNCWSVKAATRAQTIFTFAQIVAVLFIVAVGISQMCRADFAVHFSSLFNTTSKPRVGMLGSAMYNGLWSYDGWALISNVSEEMSNLERNMFLSIVTGIPFVIVCYILINLSLLSALNVSEMGKSKAVAVAFIEKTLGRKVAYIMPVFVAVSCYGAANGTIFAAARVSLAAGREGHLPAVYSMIHKTRHTPIPAVLMTSAIALLMLIPDASKLETLIGFFNFSCWFIYGLTIFGVIVLRIREPNLHRPYKVWTITPILMTIVSLGLVIVPFLDDPVMPLVASAAILLGVPFYIVFVHYEARHPDWLLKVRNKTTRCIRKSLNLAPCSINTQ